MKEKIITCCQCEGPFVFTVEEQQRYLRAGFGAPKRCPACRKNKFKEPLITPHAKRKSKVKKKNPWKAYDGDGSWSSRSDGLL